MLVTLIITLLSRPGMGNNYSHSTPRLSNDGLALVLSPGLSQSRENISRLNILEIIQSVSSQFYVPLLEVNPAAS